MRLRIYNRNQSKSDLFIVVVYKMSDKTKSYGR